MENAGMAAQEITLGEDEYFVLGDNRNQSEDSRNADIGNVKKEDIYVRHFSKERISNYLRISIGTKEEMQTMIGFLQNFLAEG